MVKYSQWIMVIGKDRTKIEAKFVAPSENIPHGINYSLTLHDKNNKRIIGYDNAHGIEARKKKFRVNRIEWDHKHERERIKPYEFEDAGQLMEDFWDDVNECIGDS